MRDGHDSRLGYLQILAGAALFGVNASVSKVVLDAGIEPARLTALRCTGVAIGLLAWLLVTDRRRLRVSWRELPALAVLGLSGAALLQWLYFVAIDRLPVGIALLIEFTAPLLVAVYLRVVRREVLHRHVWMALGIALLGLAGVAQVWEDVGLDTIGLVAAFGSAICLATFYLLGQHTLERRDPTSMSFWMFVFAALFWAAAQPWWNFDPSVLGRTTSLLGGLADVSLPVWAVLLWIVLLGTLVPYAFELAALRHLSAATTGIVGMIEPVIAAGVAWVWLGQTLTVAQMIGGALVLVGVAMVQLAGPPVATSDGRDAEELGAFDGGFALVGEGEAALVGQIARERVLGRELEQLDLERLA
jgi:drug/metabolite transporter (DMT)-like permease